MKRHSAKLLRQKKAKLIELMAEHEHLLETCHRDDCMIFMVAGQIERLEKEIAAA